MPMYGQLVVGAPGSGKTTYVASMAMFLRAMGRKVAIVNLDPANETTPYVSDVDIEELVTLEDVMESLELGPNGGLIYCVDLLQRNSEWLREQLRLLSDDTFLLFDLPGQAELLTHHHSLRDLIAEMRDQWGVQLVAVNCVDASLCTDASHFVSASLLSLLAMTHLELPHINVFSKADLVSSSRAHAPSVPLEELADMADARMLADWLRAGDTNVHEYDETDERFDRLNDRICDVINDCGLVRYLPCGAADLSQLAQVADLADTACGYTRQPVERQRWMQLKDDRGERLRREFDRQVEEQVKRQERRLADAKSHLANQAAETD
ncbi:MAG: hypothetical protein MHM6MM_001751 [Cercozoa sp. M6MM]